MASDSNRGFYSRRWVSRLLIRRRVEEGQMEGLLFAKADGTPATLNLCDPTFRRLLERAREEHSRALLSQDDG